MVNERKKAARAQYRTAGAVADDLHLALGSGSADTSSAEREAEAHMPAGASAVPSGTHPCRAVDGVDLGAGVTCCSPAVAARIFERLADGESLRAVCRDEGMPSRTAVLRWIEVDEAFASAYARARDHQADALDDEMADVMAEVRAGRMDPAAARVLLSGLQWRASKLAPRRYGERLALLHSGSVAVAPVEMTFEHAARVAQAILDGTKDCF